MSSLIHDFHSICVVCRGVDCDRDHRCPKCTDVADSVMTKYVAHKISLQHKLQSKHSKKDPVPAPVDVADAVVMEPSSSLVPAAVTSVFPVPVDNSSQMSGVRGEIMCQVKSLFDSFAQSLEARFTSSDDRFSLGVVINKAKSFSSTDSDVYLPRNGNREPFFEGFSFPGEGFHPAHTDYRISVLQAAKRRVNALSALLPVVSLPSSPRGSTSNEVSAVATQESLGFSGRVRCHLLDFGDLIGPSVVVRRSSSPGGGLSGLPTT